MDKRAMDTMLERKWRENGEWRETEREREREVASARWA